MRGTPYYFQGDELGMINIRFDTIDDYNDIDTKNKYIALQNENGDLNAFLEEQKQASRENSRTPMQWNTSKNAGFSEGKPWLKVNPNYTTINADAQEKDPDSTLNYFRKLVQLRKQEPTLVYGTYTLLDEENPKVYAYLRSFEGRKIIVLLNFSAEKAVYNCDFNLEKSTVLLSNYSSKNINCELRPFEALVLNLNER
jgi:oligo-1,6-glucosidase